MDLFDCTQVIRENIDSDSEDSDKITADDKPVAFLKLISAHQLPVTNYSLLRGKNVIGRADTCHVCISSQTLSKEHAVIEIDRKAKTFEIYDTGSSNKTRKGKIVLKPNVRYNLEDGTNVTFADIEFQFLINHCRGEDEDSDTCSESMFVEESLESDSSFDRSSRLAVGGNATSTDKSALTSLAHSTPLLDKKQLFYPSMRDDNTKKEVSATVMETPIKMDVSATAETPENRTFEKDVASDSSQKTNFSIGPLKKDNHNTTPKDDVVHKKTLDKRANLETTPKSEVESLVNIYEAETQPCDALPATQLYVPSQMETVNLNKEIVNESIFDRATQLYTDDTFVENSDSPTSKNALGKNTKGMEEVATQLYLPSDEETDFDFAPQLDKEKVHNNSLVATQLYVPSSPESHDEGTHDLKKNEKGLDNSTAKKRQSSETDILESFADNNQKQKSTSSLSQENLLPTIPYTMALNQESLGSLAAGSDVAEEVSNHSQHENVKGSKSNDEFQDKINTEAKNDSKNNLSRSKRRPSNKKSQKDEVGNVCSPKVSERRERTASQGFATTGDRVEATKSMEKASLNYKEGKDSNESNATKVEHRIPASSDQSTEETDSEIISKGRLSRRKQIAATSLLSEMPTQLIDNTESQPDDVKKSHSKSVSKLTSLKSPESSSVSKRKKNQISEELPMIVKPLTKPKTVSNLLQEETSATPEKAAPASPIFNKRRTSRLVVEKLKVDNSSDSSTDSDFDEIPLIKLLQDKKGTAEPKSATKKQETPAKSDNGLHRKGKSKQSAKKVVDGKDDQEQLPKTSELSRRRRATNQEIMGALERVPSRNNRQRKLSQKETSEQLNDSTDSDFLLDSDEKDEKNDSSSHSLSRKRTKNAKHGKNDVSTMKVDPLVLVVNKSALGSSTPYTIQKGRTNKKAAENVNESVDEMNISLEEGFVEKCKKELELAEREVNKSRRKSRLPKKRSEGPADDSVKDKNIVTGRTSVASDDGDENQKKLEISLATPARNSSKLSQEKKGKRVSSPSPGDACSTDHNLNIIEEDSSKQKLSGKKRSRASTRKESASDLVKDSISPGHPQSDESNSVPLGSRAPASTPASESEASSKKRKGRPRKKAEVEPRSTDKSVDNDSEVPKSEPVTTAKMKGRRGRKKSAKEDDKDFDNENDEMLAEPNEKEKTLSLRQYRRKASKNGDLSKLLDETMTSETTNNDDSYQSLDLGTIPADKRYSRRIDNRNSEQKTETSEPPAKKTRGRPASRGRKRSAPMRSASKANKLTKPALEDSGDDSDDDESYVAPKKSPKLSKKQKTPTKTEAVQSPSPQNKPTTKKSSAGRKKSKATPTTAAKTPNTPSRKSSQRLQSVSTKIEKILDPLKFKQVLNVDHPCISFTGIGDEQAEKIVKDLGGKISDNVTQCTHLITDKVRRTFKFLCQVARGRPIVTIEWIYQSKKAGKFIDASLYLINDSAAEKQFGFSLRHSLEIASNHSLLSGFSIHVTGGVKPEPAQMKLIIECAGGEYLSRMPTCNVADRKTTVVSCTEDLRNCSRAMAGSVPVVSAEFILTGILRQSDDIESYCLIT